jgi:hypothetical protein
MQPTHENCIPSWCDSTTHAAGASRHVCNGAGCFLMPQRFLLLAQAPRMLRRLKHSVASLSKELPPKVSATSNLQSLYI